MRSMARSGMPPVQSLYGVHSRTYSSERSVSFAVLILMKLSAAAVVENAQHDPHCPWNFTLVIAQVSPQFQLWGALTLICGLAVLTL